MANKHMNKDLIESIDSAENSNEEFFSVNFGSNKVKIFFEEEDRYLLARPNTILFSYITKGNLKNLDAKEIGKDT